MTSGNSRATPSSNVNNTPEPALNAAFDELNNIAQYFQAMLRPLCTRFIASPPSDPKRKTFEHQQLAEGIMNQVMLRLDAVEADGSDEIREKRRALIRETQYVLDELDAAAKR